MIGFRLFVFAILEIQYRVQCIIDIVLSHTSMFYLKDINFPQNGSHQRETLDFPSTPLQLYIRTSTSNANNMKLLSLRLIETKEQSSIKIENTFTSNRTIPVL